MAIVIDVVVAAVLTALAVLWSEQRNRRDAGELSEAKHNQ